ncbi:MAG TPA: four helix bundle protein [Candidatus Methylomirabilis sp.]|nr:four helix bundle protein [Candidatus Methylomirabilis sp.]
MQSIKDLRVWQSSFELSKLVYVLTDQLPVSERDVLYKQMRKCAVSIPSNLSEGYRRRTKNEMRHYTRIAYGSASELETQFLIVKDLKLVSPDIVARVEAKLDEVLRMMNRFSQAVERAVSGRVVS